MGGSEKEGETQPTLENNLNTIKKHNLNIIGEQRQGETSADPSVPLETCILEEEKLLPQKNLFGTWPGRPRKLKGLKKRLLAVLSDSEAVSDKSSDETNLNKPGTCAGEVLKETEAVSIEFEQVSNKSGIETHLNNSKSSSKSVSRKSDFKTIAEVDSNESEPVLSKNETVLNESGCSEYVSVSSSEHVSSNLEPVLSKSDLVLKPHSSVGTLFETTWEDLGVGDQHTPLDAPQKAFKTASNNGKHLNLQAMGDATLSLDAFDSRGTNLDALLESIPLVYDPATRQLCLGSKHKSRMAKRSDKGELGEEKWIDKRLGEERVIGKGLNYDEKLIDKELGEDSVDFKELESNIKCDRRGLGEEREIGKGLGDDTVDYKELDCLKRYLKCDTEGLSEEKLIDKGLKSDRKGLNCMKNEYTGLNTLYCDESDFNCDKIGLGEDTVDYKGANSLKCEEKGANAREYDLKGANTINSDYKGLKSYFKQFNTLKSEDNWSKHVKESEFQLENTRTNYESLKGARTKLESQKPLNLVNKNSNTLNETLKQSHETSKQSNEDSKLTHETVYTFSETPNLSETPNIHIQPLNLLNTSHSKNEYPFTQSPTSECRETSKLLTETPNSSNKTPIILIEASKHPHKTSKLTHETSNLVGTSKLLTEIQNSANETPTVLIEALKQPNEASNLLKQLSIIQELDEKTENLNSKPASLTQSPKINENLPTSLTHSPNIAESSQNLSTNSNSDQASLATFPKIPENFQKLPEISNSTLSSLATFPRIHENSNSNRRESETSETNSEHAQTSLPRVGTSNSLSHFDSCSFSSLSSLNTELSGYSGVDSMGMGSNLGETGSLREFVVFGEGEKKKRGLADFFTRNLFSWRHKDDTDTCSTTSSSPIPASSSPTPSQGGWRLFSRPQRQVRNSEVEAGSAGLIMETRPDTVAPKSQTEQLKHHQEYKAMINAARKKELREAKERKKAQASQQRQEEQLANAVATWNNEIIPKWNTMRSNKKCRELWWQGLPSCVRGKVWKLAIGNELNITPELYDTMLQRSLGMSVENEADKSGLCNGDQEATVDLIRLDVSRTFPHLCIFQKGGPYHDPLHNILGAYACYWPEVGYVQGMSFLAATLLLNMTEYDAFLAFTNLINRPAHMAFFTVDQHMMQAYYHTFEELLSTNLPQLVDHLKNIGVTPDLYVLDWLLTVFARPLPLDVAVRIWDVYLRDGEEFLIRAAIGILKVYEMELRQQVCTATVAQFLTRLPDDITADTLFKNLASVHTCTHKKTFNVILNSYVEKR